MLNLINMNKTQGELTSRN